MNVKHYVICLLAIVSMPAFAASSFQNSCSNIEFAYVNNAPTLKADCLASNGSANPSSLELKGISNQNGKLVQGSGSSSFQQSCGNIRIDVQDTSSVQLLAFCRTSSGNSVNSSLPLNGISNSNGRLTQ